MLLQRASRPGAQPCGGARKAVRVRFVKLPGLFKHVPLLPVFSSPPQHAVDAEQAQTSRLDSLLEVGWRAASAAAHVHRRRLLLLLLRRTHLVLLAAADYHACPAVAGRQPQRAAESTFHAPDGQLFGRAGRRCTLEDGERMLELYIQVRTACCFDAD